MRIRESELKNKLASGAPGFKTTATRAALDRVQYRVFARLVSPFHSRKIVASSLSFLLSYRQTTQHKATQSADFPFSSAPLISLYSLSFSFTGPSGTRVSDDEIFSQIVARQEEALMTLR